MNQPHENNALSEGTPINSATPPNTPPAGYPAAQSQYGQYGQADLNTQNYTAGYRTVIPMRPLGIGDTLDATIRLLKYNPKALILFPLIVSVCFTLLNFLVELALGQTTIFSASQFYDPQQMLLTPDNNGLNLTMVILGSLGLSLFLAILIFTFESAIISIAATRTVIASVRGYKLSLGDTWKIVRPRFWSLLGRIIALTFILGLISFVAVVIPGILLLFVSMANFAVGSDLGIGGVLITILFFLALTFVVITIYVRFLIAFSVLVAENCGPITALKRAWDLTRGSFWQIFALMVFTTIFLVIVGAALSLFFGLLTFAVVGFGSSSSTVPLIASTLIGILSMLVTQIFIYPVITTLTNMVYVNMRFKRENFHQQLLYEASQKVQSAPAAQATVQSPLQ
ncbi:DUF7544 domain-containing protein [Arcanobacterium hippocoleae]